MSIQDVLKQIQFVVNRDGEPVAVQVSIEAWEALLDWIENIEQRILALEDRTLVLEDRVLDLRDRATVHEALLLLRNGPDGWIDKDPDADED